MEMVFGWFVLACIVGYWAHTKGRTAFGWTMLSLFLSPLIGGFIVAVLPKTGDAAAPRDEAGNPMTSATHVRCPDCRELIRRDASKCKHCSTALVPQ